MQKDKTELITRMKIGGTTYTVRPSFREGGRENAAAKMAWLIRHEACLKAVQPRR